MLSEGLYFGKRTRHGHGKANTGTPYIFVEFELCNIAVNGAWSPMPAPQKRTVTMYLTPSARETTIAKLDSLGFNGNFKAPEFAAETATEGVELRCRHEPYTNPETGLTKTNEKWELENWGGGGSLEHKPIEDESILDVWTAQYAQAKGGGATSTAPPMQPAAPAGARPGSAPAAGTTPAAGTNPNPPAAAGKGPPPPGSSRAPAAASGGSTPTAGAAPSTSKPAAPPPMGGKVAGGPPPMVNPADVRTRDQVWNAATQAHPEAPTDVLIMRWQEACAHLRPGKAEQNFTGADWFAVEQFLVAPF